MLTNDQHLKPLETFANAELEVFLNAKIAGAVGEKERGFYRDIGKSETFRDLFFYGYLKGWEKGFKED
jgi:hypothetical protein